MCVGVNVVGRTGNSTEEWKLPFQLLNISCHCCFWLLFMHLSPLYTDKGRDNLMSSYIPEYLILSHDEKRLSLQACWQRRTTTLSTSSSQPQELTIGEFGGKESLQGINWKTKAGEKMGIHHSNIIVIYWRKRGIFPFLLGGEDVLRKNRFFLLITLSLILTAIFVVGEFVS